MKMGVKVYFSEISGSKEVKKRQQRVMMILESKVIPYDPIDISEPGKETDKDFMYANAKAKEGSTLILSPQIFNDEVYCGDYDDFDLANENDVLEEFLKCPKVERKISHGQVKVTNNQNGGGSREGSAEAPATELSKTTNGSEQPGPVEDETPLQAAQDPAPDNEDEGIVEATKPEDNDELEGNDQEEGEEEEQDN